eukprot:g44402.t1
MPTKKNPSKNQHLSEAQKAVQKTSRLPLLHFLMLHLLRFVMSPSFPSFFSHDSELRPNWSPLDLPSVQLKLHF